MFCTKVKEYLSQKSVPFTERDVSQDEAALGELEQLGYMTTPVIVSGDEVIVGFNKAKLEELLAE